MKNSSTVKYIINGKFLAQQTTGVQRYATQLVKELDKIAAPGMFQLARPCDAKPLFGLENIENVQIGGKSSQIWTNIHLPMYITKKRAIGVHLCNTAPVLRPDIVAIHDVNFRINPKFFSKAFVLRGKILTAIFVCFAKRIITVTDFSKNEIINFYPYANDKTHVIPSAWQHVLDFTISNDVLAKYSLKSGNYYFSLGSKSKNKNHLWVYNQAKKNPDCVFVVSGNENGKVFSAVNEPKSKLENLRYIGYASDNEIACLMKHCKAFLFPSFYEGFGLPPLEALGVGARIVVSDIGAHREVYEGAAYYIDPNNMDIELNALLQTGLIQDSEAILNKYSWRQSAQSLLEAVKGLV